MALKWLDDFAGDWDKDMAKNIKALREKYGKGSTDYFITYLFEQLIRDGSVSVILEEEAVDDKEYVIDGQIKKYKYGWDMSEENEISLRCEGIIDQNGDKASAADIRWIPTFINFVINK